MRRQGENERDLWPTLEDLAYKAKLASSEALRLEREIERITKEIRKPVITLLPARSTESASYVSSGRGPLYTLVLNQRLPQPYLEKGKAFWLCLKVAIREQFGGLAPHKSKEVEKLRELAIIQKGPGKGEIDNFFWLEGGPASMTRMWFTVAYLRAGFASDPRGYSSIREELVKQVQKLFKKYPKPTFHLGDLRTSDSLIKDGRQARLRDVRNALLRRLVSTHLGMTEVAVDKTLLFQRLQELLTRGSQPSPVEVSILMRTLAGRYLNGRTHIYAGWQRTLQEGLHYVLSSQGQEGTWEVETPSDEANLLLNLYSPLLHLLDLDLELLRSDISLLAETADRSLDHVLERLEVTRSVLANAGRAKGDEDDDDRRFLGPYPVVHLGAAVEACAHAYALSAGVYDRFRDLLSESVLDHLGARRVEEKLTLSTAADGLGFRERVEKQVIEPWKKGAERRPGAMLIFGPPGTGKTTIAKLIAKELDQEMSAAGKEEQVEQVRAADVRWRFLNLTPADFAKDGADGIVARAEQLFGHLQRVRRCVVLLDEMEEFLRVRGPDSDREARLDTTAFLPLLQDAANKRECLLLVATNFVGAIDPAVTRRGRFDLILPLGPPDSNSREEIILSWAKNTEFKPALLADRTPEELSELGRLLVEYSMGYTYPELISFCDDVASAVGSDATDTKTPRLIIELWRLRSAKVPTALSGRPGCNWRAFRDEVERFSRPRSEPVDDSGEERDKWIDYWAEPRLPTTSERQPSR